MTPKNPESGNAKNPTLEQVFETPFDIDTNDTEANEGEVQENPGTDESINPENIEAPPEPATIPSPNPPTASTNELPVNKYVMDESDPGILRLRSEIAEAKKREENSQEEFDEFSKKMAALRKEERKDARYRKILDKVAIRHFSPSVSITDEDIDAVVKEINNEQIRLEKERRVLEENNTSKEERENARQQAINDRQGDDIAFAESFFSPVKEIVEDQSVESAPKTELEQIVFDIGETLKKQPLSVQENWEKILELNMFSGVDVANGFRYVFLKTDGVNILSLVQDIDNPKIWKPRAFRFSANENQWKILPAMYAGSGPVRGEEDNEWHHCVQSSKLVGDISDKLVQIPIIPDENKDSFNQLLHGILPTRKEEGGFQRYEKEFEFKEGFDVFQNKEWFEYQSLVAEFMQFFSAFNKLDTMEELESLNIHDENSWFNRFLAHNKQNQQINNIFNAIKIFLDKYSFNIRKGIAGKAAIENSLADLFKYIKSEAQILTENAFKYVKMPESMLPDFSKPSNRTYTRKETSGKTTKIEEYIAVNNEGDEAVFCMATDSMGRVFIDNVYRNIEPTDYGGDRNILHMGYLVYRMEDTPANLNAIPDKYLSDTALVPGNKSMHKLWEELEIVKRYKNKK